jgi:hypothetical protein
MKQYGKLHAPVHTSQEDTTMATQHNDVADLPSAMPYHIAGAVLGMSRTTAWRMRRAGTFPLPIHQLSDRKPIVLKVDLLDYLGLTRHAAS